MTDIAPSRVDKFLAGVSSRPQQRGNLIFALDATASRERTWDTAAQLQAQMFREVALIGALDMQLVYYRGTDECKASRWVDNPMALATVMRKIQCDAGETQINRILTHASRETKLRKINALVFIGDACEENSDSLVEPAAELAKLDVPAFMFQEGNDLVAQKVFQSIARTTHGAYHRFDRASAQQFAELLRAVAAFAVGGVVALERQGSAAARLLLGQVKGKDD
jgi:hypothetical protein